VGPSESSMKDCVIGVDLVSGSPQSKVKSPLYSAVVLCNGDYIKELNKISLARLFRITWEIKPSVIAVDSLQELTSNKKLLMKIGELLPPETSLVWINVGEEGHPRKLIDMAQEHKLIDDARKPSSMQTAYILAILAKKGVGKPVFSRNEITKLVIRKARVEGKGGMSSNRYKRKIRSVIKQLSSEIQSSLKKGGLEYEVYYKRSIGGLEKAVFIIYAPINEVKKLVSQREYQDAIIEMKPVVRILSLEEKEEDEQPIIVGVDPGYNFGLAIMSIEGKVLYIDTVREASRAEITDLISKYGKPVMIATDVHPVPEAVRKLASSLNAKIFTPYEEVEIRLKREIASMYSSTQNIVIKDSHSRDALAAAYIAYREIRRKLLETEEYLRKTGLNIPTKKVQLKVVEGKSIADAVEEVINEMILTEEAIVPSAPLTRQEKSSKTLIEVIEKLKLEKELLYKQIQKKEEEIRRLEEELNKKLSSQETIISSDRRIETLYNALSTISTKLREVEEELQAERSIKSFFLDTIKEISLNRKIVIPRCDAVIKGFLEEKLKEAKVDYCFAEKLADLSSSILVETGIKSIITIYECEQSLKGSFLEEGVGVLCDAKSQYNCEVINNELLVCNPKVINTLEKEAEYARETKIEKERTKILKLLMEYKEGSRKKEAT